MYNPNVAIVVYDEIKGLCLAGNRANKQHAWQFPQGGIEAGESIIEAAKRELFEEMGLKAMHSLHKTADDKKFLIDVRCMAEVHNVCHIEEADVEFTKICGPFQYNYPKYVQRAEIGQEQTWVLAIKRKHDLNVRINYEFSEYQWMPAQAVLDNIVYFKKDVYQKALKEFGLV